MAAPLRQTGQSRCFAVPAKRGRMASDSRSSPSPVAQEFARLIGTSGRTQLETAAYLSRRLGRSITNGQVSRWSLGGRKVPVDVMDAMRELASQPATSAPVVTPMLESSDVVPLFGYANAAGPVLRLNDDQRVGVAPIHPAQKGSRSAFAFQVFGDSLHPRLRDGDIGYAVRNKMPTRGDPVLIEKKDGDVLVKIFERMDEATLFASQLSPKSENLSVPLRDILALHAVVGLSFGR